MSDRAKLMIRMSELFPKQDLCTVCINLRMSFNGAAEPWPKELVEETLGILDGRLKNWGESTFRSYPVDQAVRNLVEMTIWEVTQYLEEEAE